MRGTKGTGIAMGAALVMAFVTAQAADPPMFSGHAPAKKASADSVRSGKPAPIAKPGTTPSAKPGTPAPAKPGTAPAMTTASNPSTTKAAPPHGSMAMPGAGASPHGSMGMPGMGASPHAGGKMAKPQRKPPFKLVLPPGLPKVSTVTLEIRHRVFHEFLEVRQVPLRKTFQIGDTDYSATVTDFVPDFTIDVEARKIGTISKEPVRPAFRVIVREKGVANDTTWAFMDSPPHFSMKSLLAFDIVRIDFVDHAPVSRDTTRAAPRDSTRTATKERP